MVDNASRVERLCKPGLNLLMNKAILHDVFSSAEFFAELESSLNEQFAVGDSDSR